MSRSFRDYYTKTFRSEEDLARVALNLRRAGGIDHLFYFNIVEFVETVLPKLVKKKGELLIKTFEAKSEDEDLAYVTFNPLTLHVDEEIWQDARSGNPGARHIIAHEIGHIVLHDHYVRAFSNDPSANISFAPKEHSTEWQANKFADYFLVSDQAKKAFEDFQSLAISCSVPAQLAQERFLSADQAESRRARPSGEACSQCHNFTLMNVGTYSSAVPVARRCASEEE